MIQQLEMQTMTSGSSNNGHFYIFHLWSDKTAWIALHMYVYTLSYSGYQGSYQYQKLEYITGQHEYLNWDCGSHFCQPQKGSEKHSWHPVT